MKIQPLQTRDVEQPDGSILRHPIMPEVQRVPTELEEERERGPYSDCCARPVKKEIGAMMGRTFYTCTYCKKTTEPMELITDTQAHRNRMAAAAVRWGNR